jgi:hypothetical protein
MHIADILGAPVFRGAALACAALAAWGAGPAAFAQDNEPTAASFLDIDTDARSAAMAGTGATGPAALAGIYSNPARLAGLTDATVGAMHAEWIGGLAVEWLGFASPIMQNTGFGLGLTYLRSDALTRFDELGNPQGEFRAYDAALSFGAGTRIGRVTLGGTAKMVRQSLDDLESNGLAFDTGVGAKIGRIEFAGTMTNAGGDMDIDGQTFPLPTQFSIGASVPTTDGMATLNVGAAFPQNYNDELRVGAEVYPSDALALRGGYRIVLNADEDEPLTGLTVGAGFWVTGVQIDYAYQPFRNLGDTHRLGLSLGFDSFKRKARISPHRIPPTTAPPVLGDVEPAPAQSVPEFALESPKEGSKLAANALVGRTRQRPSPNSIEVVGGTYGKRLDALREVNGLRSRGVPGGQVRQLPTGGYVVYFGTYSSELAAREWLARDGARAPAGSLTLLPLAGENYPYEVVGERHVKRLPAYRQLLAYRSDGLEGGTIYKEADGSYRVILVGFPARSETREWLASTGQGYEPSSLEILPAPR